MKNTYTAPEIEVVTLSQEDILNTSNLPTGNNGGTPGSVDWSTLT